MEQLPNSESVSAPLNELRLWQRYHIHLTLLYGLAILLAMLFLGQKVYDLRVSSELSSLQKRLVVLVTALADSVDVQAIEETPLDNNELGSAHQRMREKFSKVMAEDDLLQSIYVFRQTEEPTQLRFFVDIVRDGEEAVPGDSYDASSLLTLLQGFSQPVVEDQPQSDSFGTSLSGYAPIRNAQGRSVGMLGADVNAKDIELAKQDVLISTLTVFGVAMAALALLSLVVAQNIRKPLNQIIDAAAAISEGKFATRIELDRKDEFGIMGRQIDQMATQLQQREFIRQTFGRYVSEVVAENLLKETSDTALGGEERVVSILFSDLKGYTTLSEQLPPTQLVKMLNDYFGAMTAIIDAHGGCVIEFLGDGILAVFGAPQRMDNHAEQAVRCALAMQERIKTLPEDWEGDALGEYFHQDGSQDFGMRIGIHTGSVVAGNLGCPSRMKYAVIGDSVNIAARLEAMNKALNSDTLISGDTFHQLPVALSKHLHSEGMQKIDGRERSLPVYAVSQ
jgi:adenylate cyclase